MIKRGRILRDTNAGPGLLTAEGTQYVFVLEAMWKSDVPPRAGMPVDVAFNGNGVPEAVFAVSDSQVAREQAQKAFSGAFRHGEAVTTRMKGRFGKAIIAAETVMLLSFFFLPCLLTGPAMAQSRLTGWEATGFNESTLSRGEYGILTLLSLVCLFAPLATPFLKQAWAHLLNVAPFAFSVLAFITIALKIHNAESTATRGMGELLGSAAASEVSRQMSGMFGIGLGAWIVLACSVYLMTQAFRKSST